MTFANVTIKQNVFDSIQWSSGSIAYVWYSWDYNGSWMFIFWNNTITWNYSITLSGYNQSLHCHEQLIWYYVNPFWWNDRIWPINDNTLQSLQSNNPSNSNFSNLNMTWGLFTSCSDEGIDPYSIFWYLEYSYWTSETWYKIWAWISWLNTDVPSFANTLFLLWWWDGSDLSASWWIFDSISDTWVVTPIEEGNFTNQKPIYLWSDIPTFEYLAPSFETWDARYTTWQNITVKLHGTTWYHWQLSWDLTESKSWVFESSYIETWIVLTDATWNKNISFFVYTNNNWEHLNVHSSNYQITLLWVDEWENDVPNTESWSVSCERSWPSSLEISTGESTTFVLKCTWTSTLTGEINSWNIHIAGYNGGSINGSYQFLDNINITFTALNTTWTAYLSLDPNSVCLANNTDICNGVENSDSVVITWSTTPEIQEPEEPSWTAPNITIITQPSTDWTQNKIIKASSTNHSGFQYIITALNTCDLNTNFNWANSYNWWDIPLSNEYYNWKYICFKAWNNYWTWYARSEKITQIDTTNPRCTWWEPSKTGLYVWETWSITLTCIDTWAWIENTSLSNSSLSATYGVLSFSNATVSWSPSNKSFSFVYTALNAWETTISILENKIRDGAWNSNIGVPSPEITVTEEDNPWHWSASCERLIQFVESPYSTWSQSATVEIEWFCWSIWGWRPATNNSASWNTIEPMDYTSVNWNLFSLTVTGENLNDKYVCAFAQTWERIETICSQYPFKVDANKPIIDLINPDNWADFESWNTINLLRSGSDLTSWISWYTLKITKPNNETIIKYFDSNTVSTWIMVNLSWRWNWDVRAYDYAWHSTIKTQFFNVEYSGDIWWWWNNNWWGWNWNWSWNWGWNWSWSWEDITWFNLISPASFDKLSLWSDIIFKWDSGEINSWYRLTVEKIWWDTIYSWFTTGISVTLNHWYFTTGAYSWSVEDIATNTIKTIPLFYVVDTQYLPDLKVNQFEFNEIKNADINEYYQSNEVIIDWLENWWYSFAYLENNIWALYINWDFVWTQWFVANDDKVRIELKASNEYNTAVSTKLIIGAWSNLVSGDFKVTTRDWINGWDDPLLTPLQKLWWTIFVDSLVEMYQNNPEKLATFLATFMQLLQDKSDYYAQEILNAQLSWDNELANEYRTYKNAVDFLYTIVKYRYDNLNVEDRTVYIAPNGKQYLVEYDEHRMAYTSPDFARPKYFPTRELFTNHIDMNNPAVWKWWIVWNVITTHNGKVYTIYETNWKWTSSNFKTAKYFDTKEDIINHILANNPASNWNHTVDPDFEQVVYTAPNGKVYKIFKTSSKWNNPNMYSSYNFVDAKYFTSLEAAKKFINQNNKK